MIKTFEFSNKRRTLRIPMSHIIYMENKLRKVLMVTVDGNFEYYGTLNEAMGQLDNRFVHFHRSYVVNLQYIVALKNNQIIFFNGHKLYLGKHSFARLKNMVENQIFY